MQPSCPMKTITLDDNEGSHLNAVTVLINNTIKANSHIPCHAPAVPWPCHATLIHTSCTVSLPCFDCAMSFMKVYMVAGKIRTASPTV